MIFRSSCNRTAASLRCGTVFLFRSQVTMCARGHLPVVSPSCGRSCRLLSVDVRSYAEPSISGMAANLVTPSQLAVQEASMAAKLGKIMDPCLAQPLQYNGSVRNVTISQRNPSNAPNAGYKITVSLDLFIPGHPGASQIVEEIAACVTADPFVAAMPAGSVSVEVQLDSEGGATRRPSGGSESAGASVLAGVKHLVAVSSCKGGVGKSSVAVQLATALVEQSRGSGLRPLRVGLLDADVYGPSLPHLVQPLDTTVRRTKRPHLLETIASPAASISLVDPLETASGLKVMSFGYVNPKAGAPGAGQANGAAVMRGPIVTKVITQLLLGTNWGDLDYLVLDMPPGTGDIIITICQSAPVSGAVIVTTPHTLATIDVVKGIEMFHDMKVPTLGIVENMSRFVCDRGTTYFPFGESEGKAGLVRVMRETALRVPLHKAKGYTKLVDKVEEECPYATIPILPPASPDRSKRLREAFEPLAASVLTELLKLQVQAQIVPQVSYSEAKGRVIVRYFTATSAAEHLIAPLELRRRYPHNGKPHAPEDRVHVDLSVKPVHFDYKGNYGVAIQWSDGYYTDIFPFDILRQIAKEAQ